MYWNFFEFFDFFRRWMIICYNNWCFLKFYQNLSFYFKNKLYQNGIFIYKLIWFVFKQFQAALYEFLKLIEIGHFGDFYNKNRFCLNSLLWNKHSYYICDPVSILEFGIFKMKSMRFKYYGLIAESSFIHESKRLYIFIKLSQIA